MVGLGLGLGLPFVRTGGGGGGGGTLPVELATSVTHGSATFAFDTPVLVGQFVDGQPFVVADRAFSWTGTADASANSLDGAVIATTSDFTDYAHGSVTVPSGTEYQASGAMKNPFIPVLYTIEGASQSQGFDEIISVSGTSGENAATTAWDGALNVDPGAAGPLAVSVGDAFSIVKAIRRGTLSGSPMTTPGTIDGSWRHFDEWCVFHVVPEVPPAGAFAPSCSLASDDPARTNYFTTSQMNLAALGSGRTLPASMPSLATMMTAGAEYFLPFQPFFGQFGETQRRYVLNPAMSSGGLPLGENYGYSGQYGQLWNDFLAAILAEGSGITNTEALYRAVAFGIQILGVASRGANGGNGAGQWAGYKQFVQLVGHLFHGSRAGIMDACLAVQGNCTHQQLWVTEALEGVDVLSGAEGSNHFHNRGTFYAEHVGKPWWVHTMGVTQNYDSNFDADYECGSAGVANFGEILNICLLKAGPDGQDGSEVIAGASDYSTDASAAVAYLDRYYSLTQADVFASNTNSIAPARHRDYYADFREEAALPLWTGAPDAVTVYPSKQASFLSATTDGFDWSLGSIGGATETVAEYQVQYSLDLISWKDVDTQAATGPQTGLAAGVKHYVRWRRRSASGWGPWTVNYKRQSTDTDEQMAVTPSGTASGAPTNVLTPALFVRTYPDWWGPYYSAAPAEVDPVEISTTTLYAGVGYWTGDLTGGFTYQWRRDGVDISGATTDSYSVDADLDQGVTITCAITNGGVTAVSAGVDVPALTEADQLFARLSTQPDETRKDLIRDLFAALKTGATSGSNILAKIDVLYAAGIEADTQVHNWKQNLYNGTYANMSVADYVIDGAGAGWAGDGVSKHINTGLSDDVASANWQQDSATYGAWVTVDGASSLPVLGLANTSNHAILVPRQSGTARARIHATGQATLAVLDRLGWTCGVRSSSTSQIVYRGTEASAANTTATTSRQAANICVLRNGNSYVSDRVAAVVIGGALTTAEHADLYNALNTYLAAIGA